MKKEQMKEKAVEILKEMSVYSPYIEAFEKNDVVTMFERYAGFWAYQYPKLHDKIKDFEQKHKCVVYAVTHEYFEFGECYTFLVVTAYKSEWKTLVTKAKDGFYAFSYVWNKDDDWCSEFGTVGIKSAHGGLRRYC